LDGTVLAGLEVADVIREDSKDFGIFTNAVSEEPRFC